MVKALLRKVYRKVKPLTTKQGRHDFLWLTYADMTDKPLVHFIGNSHARIFRYEPRWIADVISASTAHNLVKERSTTNSRDKLFRAVRKVNKHRDVIVLVFGEVDCRYHIHYQHIKTQTPMEDLIDQTIKNYSKVINEIKDMGYTVFVAGVVPASWRESKDYPHYGPPQTRAWITSRFNCQLQLYCAGRAIPYIDLYHPAADMDGFIKPEYSLDEVHLNDKIIPHVRQQLEAYGYR